MACFVRESTLNSQFKREFKRNSTQHLLTEEREEIPTGDTGLYFLIWKCTMQGCIYLRRNWFNHIHQTVKPSTTNILSGVFRSSWARLMNTAVNLQMGFHIEKAVKKASKLNAVSKMCICRLCSCISKTIISFLRQRRLLSNSKYSEISNNRYSLLNIYYRPRNSS